MSAWERSLANLERAGLLAPTTATNTHEDSRPQSSAGPRAQEQTASDAITAVDPSVNPRTRPDARVASYFNHYPTRTTPLTDSPPSYSSALRQPWKPQVHDDAEVLPGYTCTVLKSGPLNMLVESTSPFVAVPTPEWREVFVEIRGTQLAIYKLKTSGRGTATGGRLLTTYTLQQAEVGVAADVHHNVLVPATRLASLIPAIARKKAFAKEPSLFSIEKQYSLRVRAEMDQICLSSPSEQQSYSWINHIAAGIDLAPAIDDRSLPRQCTIPRRRRRQRAPEPTNIDDRAFIAQQERIMQSMYPHLAAESQESAEARPEAPAGSTLPVAVEQTTSPSRAATPLVRVIGPAGEGDAEDVDLSAIAEDSTPNPQRNMSTLSADRPSVSRQTNCTQVSTTAVESLSYVEDMNIDPDTGKWAPAHPRSLTQQVRYIRRCLPVLLAETPRHSSVMIFQGKLVRPNFRLLVLEEWSLPPPSYDAHDFAPPVETAVTGSTTTAELERSSSVTSAGVQSSNGQSTNEISRIDSPMLDGSEAIRLKTHRHGDHRTDSTLSPLMDKVVQSLERPGNVVGIVF